MTFEIKLEDQLYDIHTKQNPPNVTDKTSYLLGTDSHGTGVIYSLTYYT